jgi:PBP1b-binding outer membrane lipoprotein LpoB
MSLAPCIPWLQILLLIEEMVYQPCVDYPPTPCSATPALKNATVPLQQTSLFLNLQCWLLGQRRHSVIV